MSQALDLGIIKVVTQKYRKKFVHGLIFTRRVPTKINVLVGSIDNIGATRYEIKPNIIRNCFQKAVFGVLNDSQQTDRFSLILAQDAFPFKTF